MLRSSRRSLLATVVAVAAFAALALPAGAGAAVTIGPDLTAAPSNTFSCNVPGGCTYAQKTPAYTSTFNGTVVGWIVRGGSGPLTFRVIDGNTGKASTQAFTPPNTGVTCLPTSTPINAGDRIGVDLPAGFVSNIGVRTRAGALVDGWTPWLANGVTLPPTNTYPDFDLLLDAVIEPVAGAPAACPATAPTGKRAAALKKCKKKHSRKARKKCKKRAKKLPV